jgi:dolichol-phosphate mannosyltransferase
VFVSVVAYIYNNESTISEFLRIIDDFMHQSFENYEIILVNDCSTDMTIEKANKTIEELNGNITILNLSRKHGIELAMMAGLHRSIGDFVFEIESTVIDYPIDILRHLFKTSTSGYDIVAAASTKKPGIYSKLFYSLVNKISFLNLSLSTESLRIVSRRALNAMLHLKEKVRYRKALYAFTGYRSSKLEYQPLSNVKKEGKKLNMENISLALDVIVSFSNYGLKLAHYMSLTFFLFSIFMIGYSLYNYIFNVRVVEGWTTIMILISAGFAGLFFILGMLGEYLARVLIEVQERPFYTIKSVEVYRGKELYPGTYSVELEVAATTEQQSTT